MIARLKTGIPGLDGLLDGGLVKGSVNMVSGAAGTCKTIFCLQYLWNGLQAGETCVYITMGESTSDIVEDAMGFGWDFAKYEKKGLCKIIYHDPAQVNNLSSVLMEEVSQVKASRLVIDSTSIMGMNIEKPSQIRRKLTSLASTIKQHANCTTIIISEVPEDSKSLSRWGVEEFVVDGVIVLNYLGIGESYNRSLMIRKMRRTNHGKDIYPFEITSKGIVIKKPQI